MKKIAILAALPAAALALSACGESPQEEAMESQADATEEAADNQADMIDDMADDATDETTEDTLEDKADAVEAAGEEKADALGVPRDRRVYLRGWCNTKDPARVAERKELFRSAGMEEAARTTLESAGVGLDDVAHLDLYSCFPASVNFAMDALGLSAEDTRALTVTGAPSHVTGDTSSCTSPPRAPDTLYSMETFALTPSVTCCWSRVPFRALLAATLSFVRLSRRKGRI